MQSFTSLLRGQTRFHRLQVIEEAEPVIKYGPAKNRPNDRIYRVRTARCLCDCGNVTVTRIVSLKNGTTTSCGCKQLENLKPRHPKHGGRRSPEYHVWRGMKLRAMNENDPDYPAIGGSGITICDRWRDSFENFLADVGPRPSDKHCLIRFPDPHGGYEPSNCIWASRKIAARNRRTAIHVAYDGQTLPLRDACEIAGIKPSIVIQRRRAGWPERRWFEPVQSHKQVFRK